jgi:hypothetical protein
MKKLLTFFLIIFFFLASFNKTFSQTVSSTPQVPQLQMPSATRTADNTAVQYDLPYPGILPDNPLYFLKVVRDNLFGFFITDPLKKAEYDLLQANKRLVSARGLIDEGKSDLAITTLSKSGNYFDQAIAKATQVKNQGGDANPILSNLLNAAKKHQQVIRDMEQKTKGDTRITLRLLEERAHDFELRVSIILSQ